MDYYKLHPPVRRVELSTFAFHGTCWVSRIVPPVTESFLPTRSFLHPVDPFSVPPHLQELVADFENQYRNTRTRTPFINILDNNPDQTGESLFDYFAQILEEHGPLVAEDPLLVGELQHFPAVAKQKMEEAGGFEAFLLESLRFIKIGRCIGLAKHAVTLQQSEHGTSLDDLDDIAESDCNPSSLDLYTARPLNCQSYSSAPTLAPPVLPNPYLFYSQSSGSGSLWADSMSEWTTHNFLPNGHTEPRLDALDTDFTVLETDLTSEKTVFMSKHENFFQTHAATQTCPQDLSSVAVNTEFYQPFERCQGDLIRKEKINISLSQKIKQIKTGVKVNNREDVVLLEKELKTITINIQESLKELGRLQQKLEEEVKRDQKEKRANQEELKVLKTETEQLVEEQSRLSQNIREKKILFEAKLSDFLELSNQSAAEKMSLEEEIKRCRASLASATRRSRTAQVSVVESSRDRDLFGVYGELRDAKALVAKLEDVTHRNPILHLERTMKTCRAKVEELEKNISSAERRFQQEMEQKSRKAPENSDPSAAALSAVAEEFVPQASCSAAAPPPPVHQAAASRIPEFPRITMFEKAMESLTAMFPDCKRPDLMKYIQEFRLSSGGSLNSLALQDVVGGVTQQILDHQERLYSTKASMGGQSSPAQNTGAAKLSVPPYVSQNPAWQSVTPKPRNPLNMEDPCIICHEDMSPDETCVLECRHSFHQECIRSWLKEQNTCPTCRTHALLPEEFPALLPGEFPALLSRRRHAH